jgi:type II secretory pathway pseudopilin PulG
MRSGSPARACRGFAYLSLLVVLAVLTVSAAAVSTGHTIDRRHAEQALLVTGEELRVAIASYRAAGGNNAMSGPKALSDLLRDSRVPGVRRHLRRIPPDPLTGVASWGVVRDPLGGIAAVYSLAPGQPVKREGFEPAQAGFENASSYKEWQFGAVALGLRPVNHRDEGSGHSGVSPHGNTTVRQ